MDAERFQRCFIAWVEAVHEACAGVLALKGNQGTPRDDVELFFSEREARDFADAKVHRHGTTEKNHGRLEVREYTVCGDIQRPCKRHPWAELNSFVMVRSRREAGGKIQTQTRFYISSLAPDAPAIAKAIRQHWGIENGPYWAMDLVFRDDECRTGKKNSPANFTTVKHMASNLLRAAPHKHSLRLKRKLAGWDDQFIHEVIIA